MIAWDRLAGGAVPVLRRYPREVFVAGGAEYRCEIVWLRRAFKFAYSTPTTPRSVRKIQEADRRRSAEMVRRQLTGEALVQVGDIIPQWAIAFLERCWIVRDAEYTLWKRAKGPERHDEFGSSQEYEWVAWSAGEWGGGWRADDQAMLDEGAPLTVMELITRAAA